MNPARCFAVGIVRKDMSCRFFSLHLRRICAFSKIIPTDCVLDQWIWWFGPAAASVLLALFYNAIPPHHNEFEKEKQDCARPQSAV